MQDQRDHRGTYAVKNCGENRQAAEVNVERAERRHDNEVRQNESPSAGPRSPETAAQIGNENADLNRERTRQRLAYRDTVAHLFFRQPLAVLDQFLFHLRAQRHRSAKSDSAKSEVVPDQVPDSRRVLLGVARNHRFRLEKDSNRSSKIADPLCRRSSSSL